MNLAYQPSPPPADASPVAKAVVVEPTLVLPVEPARSGKTSEPEFRFGPHSDTLFIAQMTDRSGLAAWVHWHAPTLASIVLVCGLVLLLWRLRRVVHRFRQGGKTYCRKCNYLLTFPLVIPGPAGREVAADADTRCPECGVELAKHAPIVGRSVLTRLLVPGLISLLLIGASGRVLIGTLQPYRAGAGAPWPSAWLASKSPRLAWKRIGSTQPEWLRLSAYDLDQGARKATVSESLAYNKQISWIRHDAAAIPIIGRRPEGVSGLNVIDLETLEIHAIAPVATSTLVQMGQVHSGSDERTAYFMETHVPPGNEPTEVVIRSIDLPTMRVDRLATISVPLLDSPPHKQVPSLAFCIRQEGPDAPAAWALLISPGPWLGAGNPPSTPIPSRVLFGRGAERQEFTLTASVEPWAQPRFSDDGRSLEVAAPLGTPGSSTPGSSGLLQVDVTSGRETLLPQPPLGGQLLPNGLTLQPTATAFDLSKDGVRQYQLTAKGFSLQPRVDVSPDGRWLAAWGMKFIPTAPNVTTASPSNSVVLVWDLARLPAPASSAP